MASEPQEESAMKGTDGGENTLGSLEGLEAIAQSDRARDDLRLCAICMQWACENPECRRLTQCHLQAELEGTQQQR